MADEQQQPTREQVENLMAQWDADPVWDLEDTSGYEAYRDELREHQERMEEHWAQEQHNRLLAKAEELGMPGNIKLAMYVIGLEDTIEKLRHTVQKHIWPNG